MSPLEFVPSVVFAGFAVVVLILELLVVAARSRIATDFIIGLLLLAELKVIGNLVKMTLGSIDKLLVIGLGLMFLLLAATHIQWRRTLRASNRL